MNWCLGRRGLAACAHKYILPPPRKKGYFRLGYIYIYIPFLTTCLDIYKPYMILVALIKGFIQNHIGFAIIRASAEEWWLLTSETPHGKCAFFWRAEVVSQYPGNLIKVELSQTSPDLRYPS